MKTNFFLIQANWTRISEIAEMDFTYLFFANIYMDTKL